MSKPYTVSWFSAGVSSAVATRMAIDEIDAVFYIHIDDQHPDTLRFVKECEQWFGKPITILQSECKTVESSLRDNGGKFWLNGGTVKDSNGVVCFINTPGGAPCTRTLKKRVRKDWEQANKDKWPFQYVWGMDVEEKHRANRVYETMPEYKHLFPLIDRKIGKAEAHEILRASGIKRPAMYELGYHNNNCIGCVKGGMGYWNKIRVDFPEVFEARAKMERDFGQSCINGTYLDELDPNAGRHDGPIVDECGLLCGLQALEAKS